MYLGPNEFEPNVFEGRADRSKSLTVKWDATPSYGVTMISEVSSDSDPLLILIHINVV